MFTAIREFRAMYNDQYFSREASIHAAFMIAQEFIGPSAIDVAWCDRCQANVPMVTPETAAFLEKVSVKVIFWRAAENELHCCTSGIGASCICLNSLIASQPPSSIDENKARPRRRIVRVAPLVGFLKVSI